MLAGDASAPGRTTPRLLRVAAAVVLIAAAGLFVYFRLYSSFAPYDDEGYIQLSLQTYRAGGVLYDNVGTQYGPAFFVLQDAWHSVTGLPITSDVARLKTLVAWLLTCVFAATTIWKLTHRASLAALASIATLFHLDRLGWEPGHPQELTLLGLLGVVWIALVIPHSSSRCRYALPILLGAATGGIAMIKLNLGVFTGLACLGALVLELPAGRMQRLLWRVVAFAGISLPFLLARSHVGTSSGTLLPLAVVAGWIVFTRCQLSTAEGTLSNTGLTAIATLVATAVVVSVGLALVAIIQGTTWAGLWHGLVGQHRGFMDLFYHDPPLPAWTPCVALAAIWLTFRRPDSTRPLPQVMWIGPHLLLAVGLITFSQTWTPIRHGLYDRSGAAILAACVPPFAGLLAWTSGTLAGPVGAGPNIRFSRRLLGLLALVQPLGAYPTPGTQLAVGTLPALLLLFAVTGDWLARHSQTQQSPFIPIRPVMQGLAALSLLTLLARNVDAYRIWQAAVPLTLPGAEWLRLAPHEAAARRRAVHYLRDHADVFTATPTGCCSLYLWTGITPPSTRMTTFWEVLLSTDEQQQVIERLESAARPHLVIDRRQAPVQYRDAPLHRYLQSRFTRRVVEGDLEVWSQEPRPLLASPTATR